MQQLDAEIKQAIMLHPSSDVAVISKELTQRLGRHVPVGLIVKLRGNLARAQTISQAKDIAADTLDTKVDRIEKASTVLEKLFHDEKLPLKDRIEASKELRQWTKLGMDAAGIHDSETDVTFVVEPDWLPVANG
jgi:hypothetical protein